MHPARHIRTVSVAFVVGLSAFAASSSTWAAVLFSETPYYTVTVTQPGSDFGIVFNDSQTTRFSTDAPFVIEAGPGQRASVTLHTGARFDAKPGYVLTGLTVSAGAVAEAWEGGYGVGGAWTAINPGVAFDASGSFPTVSNAVWNQNAAIEFAPATVGMLSPALFFSADLVLNVAGSGADCGRPVCARIGAPSVRVDLTWAAAPVPEPEIWALMAGALAILALARPRRP